MDIEVQISRAAADIARCQALRRVVFVEEQGVDAAIEVDGRDGEALHFLAWSGGVLVGCARMRMVEGAGKAERVAVRAQDRGLGIGRVLMAELEAAARAAGLVRLKLAAQAQVVPFYEKLGYACFGAPFVEADIDHRWMDKTL